MTECYIFRRRLVSKQKLLSPLAYTVVYELYTCKQVRGGEWGLGDALCDAWVASDVMCCTASILNLAAISVDRSTDKTPVHIAHNVGA